MVSRRRNNKKIDLIGGLDCKLFTDQNECIKFKPDCLWNILKKKCLNNPETKITQNSVVSYEAKPIVTSTIVPIKQDITDIKHLPVKEVVPIKDNSEIPNKFKTTFYISPQLERLATQLGVTNNMRETVEPEITDEELNLLLNNIKIESDKKDTLITIVNHIIQENKIVNPTEQMNIKIKVLLDNLAKKVCRCTQKIDTSEKEKSNSKKISSEALCRSTIFQKRGIDYITHDCGDAEFNTDKYSYKMGPLLRPSLNSKNSIILRKYKSKSQ